MKIDRDDLGPGVSVLRLDGRLNMVAAASLRSAIEETVHDGRNKLVVDMSSVVFMDSSGLGALIGGLKRTRQARGDLRIAAVNDQVATVLRLTRLDRLLAAHASVEAATDGW